MQKRVPLTEVEAIIREQFRDSEAYLRVFIRAFSCIPGTTVSRKEVVSMMMHMNRFSKSLENIPYHTTSQQIRDITRRAFPNGKP